MSVIDGTQVLQKLLGIADAADLFLDEYFHLDGYSCEKKEYLAEGAQPMIYWS